jgi:hypothetical protein
MNVEARLSRLEGALRPPPMEAELTRRAEEILRALCADMSEEQAQLVFDELNANSERGEYERPAYGLLTGVVMKIFYDVTEGRNRGPITLPPHVIAVYVSEVHPYPGEPYWNMGGWTRCAACGYGYAHRARQPRPGYERAWRFSVGFHVCPLCGRDPELDRSPYSGFPANERSNP